MRNVNWTTKQLGLLLETARQCRELVYATIDDVDLENEAFWLGVCGWPRVRGDGGSLYETWAAIQTAGGLHAECALSDKRRGKERPMN